MGGVTNATTICDDAADFDGAVIPDPSSSNSTCAELFSGTMFSYAFGYANDYSDFHCNRYIGTVSGGKLSWQREMIRRGLHKCCGGVAKMRCAEQANICRNSSDFDPDAQFTRVKVVNSKENTASNTSSGSCAESNEWMETKWMYSRNLPDFDCEKTASDDGAIVVGDYLAGHAACCGGDDARKVRCGPEINVCAQSADFTPQAKRFADSSETCAEWFEQLEGPNHFGTDQTDCDVEGNTVPSHRSSQVKRSFAAALAPQSLTCCGGDPSKMRCFEDIATNNFCAEKSAFLPAHRPTGANHPDEVSCAFMNRMLLDILNENKASADKKTSWDQVTCADYVGKELDYVKHSDLLEGMNVGPDTPPETWQSIVGFMTLTAQSCCGGASATAASVVSAGCDDGFTTPIPLINTASKGLAFGPQIGMLVGASLFVGVLLL